MNAHEMLWRNELSYPRLPFRRRLLQRLDASVRDIHDLCLNS
jgi:hypothetical protein